MTIQKIFWAFDTCDCQVNLAYDTDTDTFTLTDYLQTCSFHNSISDHNQRHTVVREENSRKNDAYQLVIDHAPASMLETGRDGLPTLKKGVNIDFTVSGTAPNRVFTLIVSGVTLTQNQINTAQNFVDNKFGVGKVTITNIP